LSEPLSIENGRGSPRLEARAGFRSGRWLLGGAVLALLAAGLVLWSRDGEAVFAAYLLAAIAWCF
jgi:hypothetical protein